MALYHHDGSRSTFKTLLKQQTRFENQLTKIERDMALAMNKLSQTSSTAEKVSILESEITRQRHRVFKAAKTLSPKFGKCSFQKLTADQRQSLINELEGIRSNILKLQKDLNTAPVCDRTRQMYLDLTNQLYYIDISQAALRAKCGQKSILSATIWQTNLNAQNWILGDQTLDDVIEEYYQRSISYDNITNCDLKTPFWSEGKCINCEPKLPIFDLYRGRCVRCSNGFVFDSARRACVAQVRGEVKKCPKGTFYDAKSDNCVRVITCTGNQFFNGTTRECQDYVTCDGKWLDKTTNQCVDFAVCEGKWLDKNNNQCIDFATCPEGFTLNKETNQCDKFIICNNMFFNKETHKCEDYVKCDPDTEYLDRSVNKCEKYVQCAPNQILDKVKNTCIDKSVTKRCEPGLLLNTDTKTCVFGPVLYRFNEQASNIIQGKVTYDNYQLNIEKAIRSNTFGKGQECPADKPYSLLTSCTACEGSYFILDSQSCGNCPEGSEYNAEAKTCKVVLWISDESGKFDLNGAALAEFTKFQATNVAANPHAVVKTCAKETPYSNAGAKCTGCEENQAWDPATNACKSCEKYNAEAHKCD